MNCISLVGHGLSVDVPQASVKLTRFRNQIILGLDELEHGILIFGHLLSELGGEDDIFSLSLDPHLVALLLQVLKLNPVQEALGRLESSLSLDHDGIHRPLSRVLLCLIENLVGLAYVLLVLFLLLLLSDDFAGSPLIRVVAVLVK